MTQHTVGRRSFLGTTGALAAATFAHPAVLRAGMRDANPVRLAIIGVNGRGEDLARTFARDNNARVLALCDIDPRTFAKPLASLAKIPDTAAPRTEADFRRLLDAKDIDAVVVATPDHWHGPITVLACQAGKDVYVEKPACHNVLEGRRMVEAARKYNRVVQVGTQRRSSPAIAQAVEFIKTGALGHIGMVRAWIHQKRGPIGKGMPGAVPEGVDYAMWQGPAPDRPFYPNRFHYAWHWFWNWGTGELGNNGVHALDMARWACDLDNPTRITSSGGKMVFDDDQEVPDTQVVTWEFPGTALVWEHRMWSKHGAEGSSFGVAFDGANGTLIVDGTGWRVENADGSAAHEPVKGGDPQAAHVANFLECVGTREKPHTDIEQGHLSARLCHLGNIAHRVGRAIAFDGERETIPGDAEAAALLRREYSDRYELPSQV
jgi:predicted dehydrogenase